MSLFKSEKGFQKAIILFLYIIMVIILLVLGFQGWIKRDMTANIQMPMLLLYSLALVPIVFIIIKWITDKKRGSSEHTLTYLILYSLVFISIPSVYVVYFSLFFLTVMIRRLFFKDHLITKWKHEYWLQALFVLSSIVSAILSTYKGPAFSAIPVFILYYLILVFFRYFKSPLLDNGEVTDTVVYGMILWSAFAILHYLLNKEMDLTFLGNITETFRARQHNYILISIYRFTSMTSWLFAFSILIVVNKLILSWKNLGWKKITLYSISIILALLLILLTRGRAAIIILFAGLSSLIISYKKWILIGATVLLAASLFIIPNPKIQKTIRFITKPEHIPNMQSRLDQYEAGKNMRREQGQVFGIGLMNFTLHYQKDYPKQYKFAPVDFIHGLYISILTETGIVGFIFFFGFLTLILILLIFKVDKNNLYRRLGISFMFSLFGISLVDSILYNVQVGIVIWIIIGLAFNDHYKIIKEKS